MWPTSFARSVRTVIMVLSLTLAFTLALMLGAAAAERKYEGVTIHLQNWGGPEGAMVQRHVIDRFENETGAKVIVEAGWTSASVAKLRAQRDNPQLDLVMFDDIGVVAAGREGLLLPLDREKIPNIKDVAEKFIIEDYGVGFFNLVNAIAYSKKHFDTPPTSWTVLWDKSLKGKVILPSIDSTSIFKVLIIAAKMHGGDFATIEPGLKAMARLKPNIHSLSKNLGLVAEALNTGDAAIAAWRMDVMKEYIGRGYDIGVTSNLEEGIFSTAGSISIVKGHKAPRDALYDLINRALDPETQLAIAREFWQSPTNRKVKLPPELRGIVFHPDSATQIIEVDLLDFDRRKQDLLQQLNKVLLQ